ncbi:MAG: long-chain-fatty-acid--CoA ligase [Solirubrobacterales bacterium]
MNLVEAMAAAAGRDPDATAVRQGKTALTYAGLDSSSALAAAMLRARGVGPGDRVGLMLPNLIAFPVLYYGVLRLGAVVVPMNTQLKSREVAHYVSDSGAGLLFCAPEAAAEAESGAGDLAEAVSIAPGELHELISTHQPEAGIAGTDSGDTAVILYTSGTTGRPKGAELTHANLDENAEVFARTLIEVGPGDVVMGALPLFHSFGQTAAMNATLRAGAALTLLPRFEAEEALEILERDRVTVFLGVPTMYAAMLHAEGRRGHDLSALRTCISGGQSLPVEVLHGFEREFGCKILEGYGLSETSPVACQNRPDRERRPGSIGIPIDGVEMKIVDEAGGQLAAGEVGEILIRGPNVMKGYWRNPEATAKAISDGWLHTGDLGRTDEDGYFYVVDRKKQLVIRGGYNVFPREVEEVIYEHPAVREAAVIGIPHPELGEEVAAAVVLRDGAEAAPEEISQFVKERLAAYKYPRLVWFVEELPKGPTGKILKREISPP